MTNDDDLKVYGAEGRALTLPLPSARRSKPRLVHDERAAVHSEALVILRELRANDADVPVAQDVYDEACNLARARMGRSVQANADDPLAVIRAEYASDYADGVEPVGARLHARAELILAAAGRRIDEESYMAALHALDSDAARRVDESELGSHLANAEALSDAAEEELRVRGVRKSDPNYESLYLCEVEALARSSGVFYDPRS
jgi:hypothetical protein